MTAQSAWNFICLFLEDTQLQQQMAASITAEGTLTFSQWQWLASSQGFHFSEAEFDAALNADPALVPALEAVAAEWGIALQPESEFELTEDEMLTIAGGSVPPLTQGGAQGFIPNVHWVKL